MDNVKSLSACVLASGSKGNSTLVEGNKTKILIDIGKSCSYIVQLLNQLSIEPNEIDGILITHTHNDHTNGLKVFVKKYHPKVYLTIKMYEDLKDMISIDDCCFIDEPFRINELEIDYIKTSHDVSDSNGYIIKNNDKSLVYITDTGYINEKNTEKLRNHDIYIMESNHDIEMLEEGPYPYHLKQRIWSSKGHLSNKVSAEYLSELIGSNTKCVILAHLSETNNNEKKALDEYMKKNKDKKVEKVLLAKPKEATELVEV